jgi:hypothetical protein
VLDQHTLAGRCYVVTVLLPVRCWDFVVFSFFAIVEVAVRRRFGCYNKVEGYAVALWALWCLVLLVTVDLVLGLGLPVAASFPGRRHPWNCCRVGDGYLLVDRRCCSGVGQEFVFLDGCGAGSVAGGCWSVAIGGVTEGAGRCWSGRLELVEVSGGWAVIGLLGVGRDSRLVRQLVAVNFGGDWSGVVCADLCWR